MPKFNSGRRGAPRRAAAPALFSPRTVSCTLCAWEENSLPLAAAPHGVADSVFLVKHLLYTSFKIKPKENNTTAAAPQGEPRRPIQKRPKSHKNSTGFSSTI